MRLVSLFACCGVIASCSGRPAEMGPIECPPSTEARVIDGAETVWWCEDAAGVPTGPYELQLDGSTITTGSFVDGMADGAWVFLRPSPAADPYARLEANYSGGVPDGAWTARDDQGTAVYEHTWAQGVPCGVWKDTLPTGEVNESTFAPCGATTGGPAPLEGYPRLGDDGVWDGESCPTGAQLVEYGNERFCADAAGVRQGPWARLTGGVVVVPIELGEYVDGLQTGTWRRWHGNGVLAEEATWAAGKLDGSYVATYPSGHVESEGAYVAGQRDGEWLFGHDTGGDADRGSYANGLKVGVWEEWSASGVMTGRFEFVDGVLEGLFTVWYRDLATSLWMRSEVNVVQELAWGLGTITYDATGARGGEVYFEAGLRQGPFTYWWPNGNVMEEGTFVDNEVSYSYRSYYESGAAWVECGWIRGDIVGPFVEYWPNGQKKAEGEYDTQGVPKEETFTFWDEDGNVVPEYPL